MNEKLFNVVLMGTVNEAKEASEWIDVKGRVEEEKFRKLSADLERRRIRRYNKHIEEQEKVQKELDGLQRDRLRFEREKALRRRNTFSTARERKQCTQPGVQSNALNYLKQNAFSGGSASIAFDPSSLKYGSRHRRRTKTAPVAYSQRNIATKTERLPGKRDDATSLDAATRGESCRRQNHHARSWGAAWLGANKEQTKEENKCRWTSLMLKAEKEKMKLLSEKWIALKESKLASIKSVLYKKHRDVSEPSKEEDRGLLKEPMSAEHEIGSFRNFPATPSGQVSLPSPEARLASRNTDQHQRHNLGKYRRRKVDEAETKMPSIFCKERDVKESLSSEDSGGSKGECVAKIPALREGRKTKQEVKKTDAENVIEKPQPVVGNFLPRVQRTPEN